ncbi:MAG TPA: hypothetical protein VLB67_05530 [Acidimicrobiia bacterium]|nr:hypothetical protein [Acidimicrobiia bacterium]
MTDGIHIPADIAEAEGVPDELDSSIVGPYRFPDPLRRRLAGWIYLVVAVPVAVLARDAPLMWFGFALLVVLAAWHLMAAWPLRVDQEDVLARAASEVEFPVGHASAAVTFVGWRARPRWHVVLYSADEPPTQRALVQFDGVTGERADEVYLEAVPPVEHEGDPAVSGPDR